jgi:predicted transposase YbfD/YdcC
VRAGEAGGLPVAHETAHSIGKGHGRIEQRRCWVVTDEAWLRYLQRDAQQERWVGLKAVVKVARRRQIGETVSEEATYYISSLAGEAKRMLRLIRGHWGIENGLHWVLDMAFREDESRVRAGHGAENLAILRHLATNLLKQEQTLKVGIHAKRLRCGWDHNYLRKVLSV